MVQLKAEAPDRGNARTQRSHVKGLGAGKLVWVKVLVLEPEGPEDEEDFALGVYPRCDQRSSVRDYSHFRGYRRMKNP